MVTLYCEETPELKLGPGVRPEDPDVIVFKQGYATIDPNDPLFKQKIAWLTHPGTPFIRILDAEEAQSAVEAVVKCPECEKVGITKAFSSDRALNGHLIQHRKG
jgi:hypothetical protein